MKLRLATAADAAAIASIYAPYVTDTFISFETEPPDGEEMRRRIEAGGDLYPWFVAEAEGKLLGYASTSAFRTRRAYRFTVETSVYLAVDAVRRGIGRQLYTLLLETLEAQGFAQAVGAISLPNPASVKLHEALGFTHAGTYRDVGFKLGGWHSVGLWQRALAVLDARPREPKRVSEVLAAA
ncbi:MAG: N-acetyltransferase family protein [Pseudomonadota bacterium]|nr:N-acetyltransferase family protein [Pseudomonadota bacterium]